MNRKGNFPMGDDRDDIDKIWDRAEFATLGAFREMDEFLEEMAAEIKANRRPQTPEESARYSIRYGEILQRTMALVWEIRDRAASGDPAPHLKSVDDITRAHSASDNKGARNR